MSEADDISDTPEYVLNNEPSNAVDSIQENKDSVTLIWFNPTGTTNDEIEKTKDGLLAINDFVQCFEHVDLCTNHMKSINREKIFLIISGNDAFKLLPSVVNLPQLDSIFIFPENEEKFHRLLEDFPKIAGIFSNCDMLLKGVKDNIKHVNRQLEVVSFYDKHQYGTRDLSEQSVEFLWC